MTQEYRAVAFKDVTGYYFCTLLEHYISIEAISIQSITTKLKSVLYESKGSHEFTQIEPAPEVYHKHWEQRATGFEAIIIDPFKVTIRFCEFPGD